MLETRGLDMRFGGVQAVDGVDFTPRRRRAALPDRPQRRRQEHLLQDADRPDRAERGPDPASRHDITRRQPHEIARLGIGIKTQVPDVFDGLTVRENLSGSAARRSNAAAPRAQIVGGAAGAPRN